MIIISTMSLIALLISMILIILATTISKKSFNDREKSSPFECGFDPKSSARIPFSIQFFLIAVIFLIFDVEIVLLLPLIVTMKLTSMFNFVLITAIFIIILLTGLYHEWLQGALKWAY